ncbi:unnamed protein product [Protopolystoma xenopodis]|uniref:ALIX V-shaped domain-containing protein n=1 Tax=Protopolystoma xenopodis TaxID=117903 RepID=A0A448WU98_9PLAT|nr:unnamed protein product [Protopolystoma xenopodis]
MVEATRLLDKVEQMSKQRHSLLKDLRSAIHSDDITPDLISKTSQLSAFSSSQHSLSTSEITADSSEQEQCDLPAIFLDLFRERIKQRLEPTVELIKLNLAAQDNLASALISLNAGVAKQKLLIKQTREA